MLRSSAVKVLYEIMIQHKTQFSVWNSIFNVRTTSKSSSFSICSLARKMYTRDLVLSSDFYIYDCSSLMHVGTCTQTNVLADSQYFILPSNLLLSRYCHRKPHTNRTNSSSFPGCQYNVGDSCKPKLLDYFPCALWTSTTVQLLLRLPFLSCNLFALTKASREKTPPPF